MGFKATKPEVSIRLSTRRAAEGSEEGMKQIAEIHQGGVVFSPGQPGA